MFNLVLYTLATISLVAGFFASQLVSITVSAAVITGSILMALILTAAAIWLDKRQIRQGIWGNLS